MLPLYTQSGYAQAAARREFIALQIPETRVNCFGKGLTPQMRLKTKLVLAITGLVFVLVTVLSVLYLSQLLRQQVEQAYAANDFLAHQILYATRNAVDAGVRNHPVDPHNSAALRQTVATALREDAGLNNLLTSVIRYSTTVFDIAIVDWNGRALLSTDAGERDEFLPARPNFAELGNRNLLHVVKVIFGPPRIYDVSLDLQRNDQPFLTVRVGVHSSFLSNDFKPRIC